MDGDEDVVFTKVDFLAVDFSLESATVFHCGNDFSFGCVHKFTNLAEECAVLGSKGFQLRFDDVGDVVCTAVVDFNVLHVEFVFNKFFQCL